MRDPIPHPIPKTGARVRYPTLFDGWVEAVVVEPGPVKSMLRAGAKTVEVENQAIEIVDEDFTGGAS